MSITPLPPPPSPLDTPEQFNAKAYAFFAALEVFSVEASALDASIDFTAADVNLLLQRPAPTIALASGTANALTATFSPAIAALSAGLALTVRASAANTSSAVSFTPAPGVIAPLPVVKAGGGALTAGDIAGAGHWLNLRYDALTGVWALQNPAVATAIADGAVSSAAKLAGGVVTSPKLADGAVAATKLDGGQSGAAPVYGARAWVNFSGIGTVTIRASGNVSSVTDNQVGDYTINFAAAMPDGDYAVSGAWGPSLNYPNNAHGGIQTAGLYAEAVRIRTLVASATQQDSGNVNVVIFR